MKITNAKFREGNPKTEGYAVHLEFDLDSVPHHLPVDESLKPIFLRSGIVPFFRKDGEAPDPSYLVKGKLPIFVGRNSNVSDNPMLVKLGLIHFLENHYQRAKTGIVIDKLDLRELVEFGIRYYEPDLNLPDWKEIIKRVWSVKIFE